MNHELLDQLYSAEPVHIGGKKLVPTPEQLEHLKNLWPTHHKETVAEALGVSLNVARRWFRDYVEPGNAL